MKLKLIILLFFNLLIGEVRAQGYLGSNLYGTVEVLHPLIGVPALQLGLGIPFKRFYSLELQLNYQSQQINIMNNLAYVNAQNYYASEEYYAGKVRLKGTGVRISIKNFKKASAKAAPVGWYMSYSFEFWKGNIDSKLNIKSDGKYDGSTGQFVYKVTPLPFIATIKSAAFMLTPGRSFMFSKRFFLDIALDIGFRSTISDDLYMTKGDGRFYTEKYIFENRINEKYLWRFNWGVFESGITKAVYEPIVKIGYLF